MDNLVQLNQLKAEGFENIRASVEALQRQVQEAGTSHKRDSQTRSLYDAASEWQNIARADAFEKGKKTGYAEACADMLSALQEMKGQVDKQQAIIQEMISDLEDDETVDLSISEENSDPLD